MKLVISFLLFSLPARAFLPAFLKCCVIALVQARGLLRTGQRTQVEARGRRIYGNQHQTPVSVRLPKRQEVSDVLPAGNSAQVRHDPLWPLSSAQL